MSAIECHDLGRRYGDAWAVRGCDLTVPVGRVAALVGPNGAGKTTLLHLVVGLTLPSEGSVRVLDGLIPASERSLDRVAFVPQAARLYKHLTVGDCLHVVRNLNSGFDGEYARRRLKAHRISMDKRVGKLSGGQEAQLALTFALARRAELLVLDEPVAGLDPIARLDFMAELMEEAARSELSVLISSHIVSDLERVADYVIVMSGGSIRLAGDVDDILANHRALYSPVEIAPPEGIRVINGDFNPTGRMLVHRPKADQSPLPNQWELCEVGLEELVLGYLRDPPGLRTAYASPASVGISGMTAS